MSIRDTIVQNGREGAEYYQDVAARASEEIRGKQIDNDIKEQDKSERKLYANLSFTIVTMWLVFVLIIFIAIGKGFLKYSDNVVIAFLTTTTIEVIGIYLIVANYLFPLKKNVTN